MNKFVLAVLLITSVASIAAGQKFNHYQLRWETVPVDWTLKFNPYTLKWSYQPEGAKIEYNPYGMSWDWDSGHN